MHILKWRIFAWLLYGIEVLRKEDEKELQTTKMRILCTVFPRVIWVNAKLPELVLNKFEFAQNTCLSLSKPEKVLPKCCNKFSLI